MMFTFTKLKRTRQLLLKKKTKLIFKVLIGKNGNFHWCVWVIYLFQSDKVSKHITTGFWKKKSKGNTNIQGEDQRHRICTAGPTNGLTGGVNNSEKIMGKMICTQTPGIRGVEVKRNTFQDKKNMGFGGIRAGKGQTTGVRPGNSK